LILTRQDVPVLDGTAGAPVDRGAYVLHDPADSVVTLIGTGSEVHVCLSAAHTLAESGTPARVVSMPSWELFEAQDPDYRASVLPEATPAVSLEAGVTLGWDRYADRTLGIDRFGASAPGGVVMEKLGITAEAVVAAVTDLIGAE
jgi:transketolase